MNGKPETVLAPRNEIRLYDYYKIINHYRNLILIIILISFSSALVIGLFTQETYRGEIILKVDMSFIKLDPVELCDMARNIQIIIPEKKDLVERVKFLPLGQSNTMLKVSIDLKDPSYFMTVSEKVRNEFNNLKAVRSPFEKRKKLLNKELGIVNEYVKYIKKDRIQRYRFNQKSNYELEKIKMELESQIIECSDSVTILSATINQKPIKPRYILYLVFATFIGLLVGVLIAQIMYALKFRTNHRFSQSDLV